MILLRLKAELVPPGVDPPVELPAHPRRMPTSSTPSDSCSATGFGSATTATTQCIRSARSSESRCEYARRPKPWTNAPGALYTDASPELLPPGRQTRKTTGHRCHEHSLLTPIWHMLVNNIDYHELGPDHFTRREPAHVVRRITKQANAGSTVRFDPLPETAGAS